LTAESGISFTEFSYQLLQAHDFQVLHGSHKCRAQIGGSDQWGNIVAGIDLIKRSSREQLKAEEEPFGLTIPLLTTSSGEKFGKSAGNAVWLDEKMTGVHDFYQVSKRHRVALILQFFLRTTDADVGRYLKLFTFLPLERIQQYMTEHEARIASGERTSADITLQGCSREEVGPKGASR
jgi:tyrosyl-tRNA synthetase